MELNERIIAAKKEYSGATKFTIAAGKNLIIETTPSGAEILNTQVPTGKQWNVYLYVCAMETDA